MQNGAGRSLHSGTEGAKEGGIEREGLDGGRSREGGRLRKGGRSRDGRRSREGGSRREGG